MPREYRTSLQFPAKINEAITVRDGRGRTVETWTVVSIQDTKTSRWIAFNQVGYRNAGAL